MVQVKGIPRRLVQRFSRDFAGSVKYSTLCPARRDSPCEASRAMPTSGDFSGSGNKGRDGTACIRFLFANHKAEFGCRQAGKQFRQVVVKQPQPGKPAADT